MRVLTIEEDESLMLLHGHWQQLEKLGQLGYEALRRAGMPEIPYGREFAQGQLYTHYRRLKKLGAVREQVDDINGHVYCLTAKGERAKEALLKAAAAARTEQRPQP